MIPGMAALHGIFAAAPVPAQQPVKPGEMFRGFTPADFKDTIIEVTDSTLDGWGAVARVARTVFARKGKVDLALEVFTVETMARGYELR